MLQNAVWAPNHKLTQPWRFHVYLEEGMDILREKLPALMPDDQPVKRERIASRLNATTAVIAVCVEAAEVDVVRYAEPPPPEPPDAPLVIDATPPPPPIAVIVVPPIAILELNPLLTEPSVVAIGTPPFPTIIVYDPTGRYILVPITTPPAPPPPPALNPPLPPPPTINISQIKLSVVVKVYCVCPVNPEVVLV